jgi:hypothetical protein
VKFKKEDLGLYFALGLVGAGSGLLVGAIVSQKLTGPEPIFIPELPKDKSDFSNEVPKTVRKFSRVEKSEEKEEKNKAKLIAFIDAYSPTTIELAMLDKGMTTMDELKMAIEQRTGVENAEPTNYHGAYHVGDLDEDKPDLEDLVDLPDEIEVIDDRWEISSTMTPDKSRNNLKAIYRDSENDRFLSRARSGDYVRMNGLENTVTIEVWNAIAPFLLSGMGPVFVNDLLSPKHYVFDRLSEEAEVSSTSSSASS